MKKQFRASTDEAVMTGRQSPSKDTLNRTVFIFIRMSDTTRMFRHMPTEHSRQYMTELPEGREYNAGWCIKTSQICFIATLRMLSGE